jgi:hypothetical protein
MSAIVDYVKSGLLRATTVSRPSVPVVPAPHHRHTLRPARLSRTATTAVLTPAMGHRWGGGGGGVVRVVGVRVVGTAGLLVGTGYFGS